MLFNHKIVRQNNKLKKQTIDVVFSEDVIKTEILMKYEDIL